MKFNQIIIASVALGAALAFSSCKPTEANYRKAYDAALAKREEAAKEQMRPATGLLSDDGPQLRVYEGDSIYVDHQVIRTEDGVKPEGKWAMAVGRFKMDTNARAAADALRQKGWKQAFLGRSSGGNYYTIALLSPSLDSIAPMARQFKTDFPEYPYVGLPGAPVLISY